MKVTPHPLQNRGGALITVIILTAVLTLLVGSYLQWGLSEMKVNQSYNNLFKARNAAESTIEYGVGQLAYRWETQSSFQVNELAPPNQLVINENFSSLFNDNPNVNYDLELKGGIVEIGQVYIDPTDPANENDPHKGKLVSVKSVNVYGAATVTDSHTNQESSAYGVVTFEVRDAPLFSCDFLQYGFRVSPRS